VFIALRNSYTQIKGNEVQNTDEMIPSLFMYLA